jgi:rhodanese-related sulfurtransferase
MLKRIITISIAVVITLMLGACSGDFDDTTKKETDTKETMNKEQTITYRQISMDEAVIMMQNESNYIILDVRRPDEFASGHIPNAVNVPNESIGISDIPELPDKDQLIMVYCRSGRRSKEASEKLVALGYTNIVEFGGILDWTGEIVSGE